MKTFEELMKDEPGTIYVDQFRDGIRFLVLRGPSSLCAYVGVPETHPLAGLPYGELPLDCHGGLTFSGKGDGTYWPKGFYWYGWDYGHCNDQPMYKTEYSEGKKWTVEDVDRDSQQALLNFKHLVNLAEKIAKRTTA